MKSPAEHIKVIRSELEALNGEIKHDAGEFTALWRAYSAIDQLEQAYVQTGRIKKSAGEK